MKRTQNKIMKMIWVILLGIPGILTFEDYKEYQIHLLIGGFGMMTALIGWAQGPIMLEAYGMYIQIGVIAATIMTVLRRP